MTLGKSSPKIDWDDRGPIRVRKDSSILRCAWRNFREYDVAGYVTSLLFHVVLMLALMVPIVGGGRGRAPLVMRIVSLPALSEPVEFELLETSIRRRNEARDLTAEPVPQAAASPLDLRDSNVVEQVLGNPRNDGPESGVGEVEDVDSQSPAGRGGSLPPNAVQAGSFAAWWIPEVKRYGEKVEPGQLPRIGQEYQIIVQVSVPEDCRTFPISDLSGEIVGTDGYKQPIPDRVWLRDTRGKLVLSTGHSSLRATNGSVQVVFKVQGAGQAGVRDTIRIQSRMLDEEQTLVLVFQPLEVGP
jgi:hypothetical protein